MKKKALFVIMIAALAAAACGGQTAQPEPQPAVQEPVVAAPVEAAPVEAAPAEQPAAPQPQPESSGGLMSYTAPEGVFKLDVPASWGMDRDTITIEKTVFETFTSPDGHAFVQVLVNDVGQGLNHVLKGEVTVDYMRRLYGSDLRIATDVTLKDGREKLEWWSDQNKTSGTTYFNQVPGFLFFYTVGYEDAYENEYESVLEDVANSFSY